MSEGLFSPVPGLVESGLYPKRLSALMFEHETGRHAWDGFICWLRLQLSFKTLSTQVGKILLFAACKQIPVMYRPSPRISDCSFCLTT